MQGGTQSIIAGAVDFSKELGYVVWLRPGRIAWPPGCSCCLRTEPDNRTVTVRGRTFFYPICASCSRHSRIHESGLGIAVVVGLTLPVAAYISLFGLSYLRGGLYLTALAYIIAAIASGGPVYLLLKRCFFPMTQTCAASEWPVTDVKHMEDFSLGENLDSPGQREFRRVAKGMAEAAGPDRLVLSLNNAEFARQFISANGGDPTQMIDIGRAAMAKTLRKALETGNPLGKASGNTRPNPGGSDG